MLALCFCDIKGAAQNGTGMDFFFFLSVKLGLNLRKLGRGEWAASFFLHFKPVMVLMFPIYWHMTGILQ